MTTYTLWAENFVEIAISCTVSEINTFCVLCEFQDGHENGEKLIYDKKYHKSGITCGPKISSKSPFLAPFLS